MTELARRHCQPCRPGDPALGPDAAQKLLAGLDGWELHEDGKAISRGFRFKNYYETMAFVNSVAWIAHREDHHPDLEVGYNRCVVHYSTHSVAGLSDNDFICAARIDALLEAKP